MPSSAFVSSREFIISFAGDGVIEHNMRGYDGDVAILILLKQGGNENNPGPNIRRRKQVRRDSPSFFFSNKFALSSYHSWIFRAVKWENIKLNYACMKQWKSAVGHCSFSSVFFSATWSSQQNPCLISAHDKCPNDLQTPDLGMYVGCCYTAVHSAAQ